MQLSAPASFLPGALSVRCTESQSLATPLLTNAFGLMSERWGELEVQTVEEDAVCWSREPSDPLASEKCLKLSETAQKLTCLLQSRSQIKILLNRDMSSNVFHFLFNELFPLYKMVQRLGLDLTAPNVVAVVIDEMEIKPFERQVFSMLLKDTQKLQHWFMRPFPCKSGMCRICEPAVAVGANRHWHTWLHSNSDPVLVPFANWIR
jgi:hypothetical protein